MDAETRRKGFEALADATNNLVVAMNEFGRALESLEGAMHRLGAAWVEFHDEGGNEESPAAPPA